MRMLANKKAVSTFILVILMLCSAVFGGLLSYLWVMSNFYLESQNIGLVITEVGFQVDHADYFNVTVMNPSHSPSETNITEIYFTVEGDNSLYNVTRTYPEMLPIPLERGTSKTVKCLRNWGNFAGKTITVHVSGANASGAVYSAETEFVKLEVQTYFNATESVQQFNATVKNDPDSAINLTLSKVYFDYDPVGNLTLELPRKISQGESINFQCFLDWEGHGKPLVQVETSEGYIGEVRTEVPSVIILQVANVIFNETNPNEVSITLFNSADSATLVDITDIVLAYANETEFINKSLINPPLPYKLDKNKTATFNCNWNWTDESYRDLNVTITAYTKQGFVSESKTVETPRAVVAKITDLEFDLDDTGQFYVNVTNMPCSLYEINVTDIMFDQNSTAMNYSLIGIGGQESFTCGFNWTSFVGRDVVITANITYNVNETSFILYNLTLPYVKIRTVAFSNFSLGNPYLNVTIYASEFSTINATITRIFVETENGTFPIDGAITNPKISQQVYNLTIGTEITIVCPMDWSPYLDREVTVIVQTADGFQVSKTAQVIPSPP